MKHSDELKNIAKALAKFQGDVKDPAKDKPNPFFKSKYVALDGLLDAVRPVLAANGLSFIQSPVSNGQDIGVTTLLMHESGEWIESDPFYLHAAKNDPQAGGSAVTYARRYSLSAVLGVAWDEDDDANVASLRKTGDRRPEASGTTNHSHQQQKAATTPNRPTDGANRNKLLLDIAKIVRETGTKRTFANFLEKAYGTKDINTLSTSQLQAAHGSLTQWLKNKK